jgi:hypothetical protein
MDGIPVKKSKSNCDMMLYGILHEYDIRVYGSKCEVSSITDLPTYGQGHK